MHETPRGRVVIRAANEVVRRILEDGLAAASTPGPTDRLPQGLGIRPADGESDFHWLYWGRCPVVRTRDAERLVTALEHHVSMATPTEDQLLLRMSAGVDAAGDAFLLPKVGPEIVRLDRRLRSIGAVLTDQPFVTVDATSAELVIEAPAVRLAPGPRQALLEALGTSAAERTVEPGRYRVARWLVEDRDLAPRRPADVTRILGALAAPASPQAALGVASMLERLRKVVITMREVSTVVDSVSAQGR